MYLKCAVFALKCGVQTYDWGKHGATSEVARLAHGADKDFKVDANTPYAEVKSHNSSRSFHLNKLIYCELNGFNADSV